MAEFRLVRAIAQIKHRSNLSVAEILPAAKTLHIVPVAVRVA